MSLSLFFEVADLWKELSLIHMSGAHYKLLRRCVGTLRLPPIAQLREAIMAESQDIVQDPHALAKHLPLRLLNTNASCTLGVSLPFFGKLRILEIITSLQCCQDIAQTLKCPSVIEATTRVRRLRAILCNISFAI